MSSPGTDSPDRRSELLGLKLAALVRDHLAGSGTNDVGDVEPLSFSPGAALRHGDEVWTLVDDGAGPRLGASLAIADRQNARALSVIAADLDSGGVMARRAAGFSITIDVYVADGRRLVRVAPARLRALEDVPAHHEAFVATIETAGVTPVREFGVLVGEVRGLEVCRVVDDPATESTRLEVGVGAHDREAFQMLHGDVPAPESLARVADVASTHRGDSAAPHPLNRLAAERRLRAQLVENPRLIGLADLAVEPPPVPRPNLKDPTPCVAVGLDDAGGVVVVVCSTGVDLEVIPYAVDARLAVEQRRPGVGSVRTIVVTPIRDRIGVTRRLADQLNERVELMSIDGN